MLCKPPIKWLCIISDVCVLPAYSNKITNRKCQKAYLVTKSQLTKYVICIKHTLTLFYSLWIKISSIIFSEILLHAKYLCGTFQCNCNWKKGSLLRKYYHGQLIRVTWFLQNNKSRATLTIYFQLLWFFWYQVTGGTSQVSG